MYCREVSSSWFRKTYYCDWDGTSYSDLDTCYAECSPVQFNSHTIHVSKAELEVLGGFAGVLLGAVFIFALFKALISG